MQAKLIFCRPNLSESRSLNTARTGESKSPFLSLTRRSSSSTLRSQMRETSFGPSRRASSKQTAKMGRPRETYEARCCSGTRLESPICRLGPRQHHQPQQQRGDFDRRPRQPRVASSGGSERRINEECLCPVCFPSMGFQLCPWRSVNPSIPKA